MFMFPFGDWNPRKGCHRKQQVPDCRPNIKIMSRTSRQFDSISGSHGLSFRIYNSNCLIQHDGYTLAIGFVSVPFTQRKSWHFALGCIQIALIKLYRPCACHTALCNASSHSRHHVFVFWNNL